MQTFLWHDYETFGSDPRRDRPVQFAALRTTMDLNVVGEPVSFYCKPARDVLPSPGACLVTGITPQRAELEGVIEAEFAARVHEPLAEPGTCAVGYNSLRFDDEFTRHLLYRNFYDPYAREWENGNSRWDVIDLARMCYALRPHGIEWPKREDGSPSFRLEDLARANHIVQHRAHDALSDAQALLGFARVLRARQPKLWDWHLALRRKQRVFELLDVVGMTPMLHVSSRYPVARGSLAMIAPLAGHPTRPNGVIVFDLDSDPTPLIELDAAAIADRVFTRRADLPEGIERIPLKLVHANRSPALAPLSVLQATDTARIALDTERNLRHLEQVRTASGLAEKVRQVFARETQPVAATDTDIALYDCFFSDDDRPLLRAVRETPPEQLGKRPFAFKDTRCAELLFRYRARNWPHTLDAEETQRWETMRRRRLETATPATPRTLEEYFAEITALRAEDSTTPAKHAVLDQLEQWGRTIL
ncbi:MAG TPA: exodeoxyribonuclease I [Rhodanobacteraceae bacterium]|jgi:exodeoxyribonuclease-1|nr:exodeoxyribonuclease I [Rhodanobacteraceae bacterium]